MACVYILQSEKTEAFYVGSTSEIKRRFREHQQGKVPSTKGMLPVKLLLHQQYPTLSLARRIESKLKRFKRRDFLIKIIEAGEIKMRL